MFLRMASLPEMREDASFLLEQEENVIETKMTDRERIMIVFFMTVELPDVIVEDTYGDNEIYQHEYNKKTG